MIKTTTEIVMNALESNMYIRMLGVTTGGGGRTCPCVCPRDVTTSHGGHVGGHTPPSRPLTSQ